MWAHTGLKELKFDYLTAGGRDKNKITTLLKKDFNDRAKDFFNGMYKWGESTDNIAKDWCKKNEDEQDFKNDEQNMCKVIVQSYWEMGIDMLEQSASGVYNIPLKAYMRCAFMSTWLGIFNEYFCGTDNVIKHALKALIIMDRDIGGVEKIDYDKCLKTNFYEEFIDNVSIHDLILSILKSNKEIVDKVLDKWKKKTNKGMNSNDRIWNSVDKNEMKRGIRKVQKIWIGIKEGREKQKENSMLELLKTKMEESWNKKGNEEHKGSKKKDNLEKGVKNLKNQREQRGSRALDWKLITLNDNNWETLMEWWKYVKEVISNSLDESDKEENGCNIDTGTAVANLQASDDTATLTSTTVGNSAGLDPQATVIDPPATVIDPPATMIDQTATVIDQTAAVIAASPATTDAVASASGMNDPLLQIPQSNGAVDTVIAKVSRESKLIPKQTKDDIGDGLLFKEAGLDILIPYIPIIPILISIFIPSFLIWKHLYPILFGKRRRYRRMHQMSVPALEENIFEHKEKAADLPPVSYGYTMIKKRHPRFSTRRTKKGVKRTIIDIHLEVLNECQKGDSHLAKEDFLEILVNEFMGEIMQTEQELTEEENISRNSLDIPSCDHISIQATLNYDLLSTSTDYIGTNKESGLRNDDFKESDINHEREQFQDPIEVQILGFGIQEQVQEHIPERTQYQFPGHVEERVQEQVHEQTQDMFLLQSANCACWVDWIERNKYILEECTTQPWFQNLKSDWKGYQRECPQKNIETLKQNSSNENSHLPSIERQKKLWKQWVSKQHKLLETFSQENWFKHLLDNIEEEQSELGSPQQGEQQNELETEVLLEVEQPNGLETEQVRKMENSENQLYEDSCRKKEFIAKLWMLILALVVEECEMENNLHEKELYVDRLLRNF